MIKKFKDFIKEEYNYEDGNYEYEGHLVKDVHTNTYQYQNDFVSIIVNDEEEYVFEIINDGEDMFIKPFFEMDKNDDFIVYVYENLNDNGSLVEGELSEFLSVDTEDYIGEEIELDEFNIVIEGFNHSGGVEEGWVSFYLDDKEVSVSFIEDATSNTTYEIRDIRWELNEQKVEKIYDFDMDDFFDFAHNLYQKHSGVNILIGE